MRVDGEGEPSNPDQQAAEWRRLHFGEFAREFTSSERPPRRTGVFHIDSGSKALPPIR